jgi:hypothetical protein
MVEVVVIALLQTLDLDDAVVARHWAVDAVKKGLTVQSSLDFVSMIDRIHSRDQIFVLA